MEEEFTRFDAAEFLDNDEVIVEYLSAAMENENPSVFLAALDDVARTMASPTVQSTKGN